jgi:hypothetical protein
MLPKGLAPSHKSSERPPHPTCLSAAVPSRHFSPPPLPPCRDLWQLGHCLTRLVRSSAAQYGRRARGGFFAASRSRRLRPP